jgi:hypothetical protein
VVDTSRSQPNPQNAVGINFASLPKTIIMKKVMALLGICSIIMVSCTQTEQTNTETILNKAGDKINDAVDEAGKKLDKFADTAKVKLDHIGDSAGVRLKRVGDSAKAKFGKIRNNMIDSTADRLKKKF